MKDDAPDISKILNSWLEDWGQKYRGDGGTEYLRIPPQSKRESLVALARTLKNKFEYTYEELDDKKVSKAIITTCWKKDKITKMSQSKVESGMRGLAEDWQQIIDSKEFSGIEVLMDGKTDTPVATEYKKEITKEQTREEIEKFLNPENLIVGKKIDRSESTNWELLKELGIEPNGSTDE